VETAHTRSTSGASRLSSRTRRLDHERPVEPLAARSRDAPADLGRDERVHQRVEARAPPPVREHERAERTAIDRAIGPDHARPKASTTRAKPSLPGR